MHPSIKQLSPKVKKIISLAAGIVLLSSILYLNDPNIIEKGISIGQLLITGNE